MSTKYLGQEFDIHGGGMDLQFPHHESEIAQSTVCNGYMPARYWLHNNMITINGKKMGKSYNNVIKLSELFTGEHPSLEKAYGPMTIRFFILQTHYSSTLNFSNEALQAAERGLKRLSEAYETLTKLSVDESQFTGSDTALNEKVQKLVAELDEFMNDDFNTAKVLANLFDLVPVINAIKDKHLSISALSFETFNLLKLQFRVYLQDVLGLKASHASNNGLLQGVVELLIQIRKEARQKKDFATSDKIRNELLGLGVQLKDEKDGNISWTIN